MKIELLLKFFFLGQIDSIQQAEAGKSDLNSFASLICGLNFGANAMLYWRHSFRAIQLVSSVRDLH